MDVDTGAAATVMSEDDFHTTWTDSDSLKPELQPTNETLETYTGESVHFEQYCSVAVRYEGQKKTLPLLIGKGSGPTLLGRNWLEAGLKLNWPQLYNVNMIKKTEITTILEEYKPLFSEELGCIKATSAKFAVDQDATPRFLKARPVPYALRDKVNEELKRLEEHGIIERVQHSDWAAPIVPVLKQDGKGMRICGDFRTTVNPILKMDTYPIPRVEDLYARLAGGKTFTTIDLSNAYLQVVLDDDSRKYTTVNTPKGLFQYTRMPFGVSSAPSQFQRIIDSILVDIPGVCCYLDDILVTGSTEADHLNTLKVVLQRLTDAGVKVEEGKVYLLCTICEVSWSSN